MSPQELQALRRRVGTQAEVARLLGFSKRTVGAYEQGKLKPRPYYVLALQRLIDEKANAPASG